MHVSDALWKTLYLFFLTMQHLPHVITVLSSEGLSLSIHAPWKRKEALFVLYMFHLEIKIYTQRSSASETMYFWNIELVSSVGKVFGVLDD